MVRRILAFSAVIALVASVGAVTAGPAAALNVVTVTNTLDDGSDSLRDAVDIANADGDDTEIVLTAGATYTLTICDDNGGDDSNAAGDLDHDDGSNALTITGNGATIEQTCVDRVIDNNNTGTITLDNVTITGGDEPDGDGGGLQSDSEGDAVITNSTFTKNKAQDDGGAIDIGFDSDLTVTGSTFTENSAGSAGGTDRDGGAIHRGDSDDGTMTITDSVFRMNKAEGAGAIHNGDEGTATLTRVTIDGNEATGDDSGAIDNGDGATLTITHSTLSNNKANEEGGAIENDSDEEFGGGLLTITNSTLSGNTAIEGGAIDNGSGAHANLHNVTVTNNTTSDGVGFGALQNADTGVLTLRMTIVANNPGGDCGGGQLTTSEGWNIDNDDSCSLTATGDKPATDPVLGALADNGGPTLTHLPLAGSPAIDMGTNDRCPADDQRGVVRPQDGTGNGEAICDIGAVEVVFQAPPETPTTTVATTTTAAASPQALTPTFTG